MQWLNQRRGLLFVCFGLLGALVGITAYATEVMKGIEFDSIDARFGLRGEQEAPDDIVVVAIDTETLTQLDVRYPFARRLHAAAIDAMREDGVKQISYDVQFTEQTSPRDDNALIEAVGRTPHMVLATTEVGEQGQTQVLGGDELLKQLGARAAHAEFEPDQGVYRRVHFELDGLETFSVATVESGEGVEVDESDFDEDGAWIDYYGDAGSFQYVSFVDVIEGRFDPGTFEGKTVVVGVTASTEQDVHATPFSDQTLTPGAEIQATAIATVRDGNPLSSAPGAVAVLLIALLSFVPVGANLRLAPLAAFLVSLAAAALYLAAAQLAFNAGTILPIAYPLLGLVVSSIGSLGAQYLREAFERQRTRDNFARFAPETVVAQVLEKGGEAQLGGNRFEATVMFSDMRGFTSFSESRAPEEVIGVLNRYLTAMTDAILDHGGTLVAYMGDGIMAVFGAPIEQEDHADRAVSAAKEMLGPRLGTFNDWIVSEGMGEPFRMGVGLNSGPVMSGMVGSERRLEYTAIGDTTNTAARLEAMTKGTDHQLFVADSTRSRLHGGMDAFELVEEMPVRGRKRGIKVWTLPEL